MSDPVECQLIGRWRIGEAELWEPAYLDLAGLAYLEIADNGWAEFAFGAIEATAEPEYGRTIVFFRWTGSDEGDEISGDGSAKLQNDGTIEI